MSKEALLPSSLIMGGSMVKVRIWTKDAAEPVEFIAESISFIGGFVVLTHDMVFSSYMPIETIRLMERSVIKAENIVETPEAWGDPIRLGAVIGEAKPPKKKMKSGGKK